MRALVTGATGFIGGALAKRLLSTGWDVDLLVRPASRKKITQPGFTVIEGDLAQPLLELNRHYDRVYHAAAIRNRWGTSLEAYRQINVEGTHRLMEACLGRADRFIYISSVGVFGYPGVLDIDESFPVDPGEGKNGYHTTKAQAEQVVHQYDGQIETVIVRPSITYGPGDEDGMLTRLIELVDRGMFLRVGRGSNHFHLIYIDDLLAGLELVGSSPQAGGETFILAGPRAIEVNEMLSLLQRKLQRSYTRLYIPERLARLAAWSLENLYRLGAGAGIPFFNQVPFITCDKIDTLTVNRSFSYTKAARVLGYQPGIDYEEGVSRTLDWMIAERRIHRAIRSVALVSRSDVPPHL